MASSCQSTDEKAGILPQPCTVLSQTQALLHGTAPGQAEPAPLPAAPIVSSLTRCWMCKRRFWLPACTAAPRAHTTQTRRERHPPKSGAPVFQLGRPSPAPGTLSMGTFGTPRREHMLSKSRTHELGANTAANTRKHESRLC